MASLKDLLAEDGFQGGKMKWKARTSFRAETAAMQKVVSGKSQFRREQSTLGSAPPNIRGRNQRTRSDVSWLGLQPDPQKIEQKTGDSSGNKVENERFIIKCEKNLVEIEIVEEADNPTVHKDDRISVEHQEDRASVHRISNGRDGDQSSKNRYSIPLGDNGISNENERAEEMRTFLAEDGRSGNRSSKPPSLDSASQNSSKSSRNSGDLQIQKRLYFEQMVSKPALDEAAIRATISILTDYVRRFPKDQTFRTSLRQNCLSCLGSTGLVDPYHVDTGVVANFRHALESVERIVDKSGNKKELKKACLQLSVITGLNSNSLTDGFTAGISNSTLAACAHLYLSVIYKLQKKDLISAKHLLHVFCDSPFQARTVLLPELWDQLFLPHLSHLQVWYEQETEAISNIRKRKMKHLDKVYNEILNDGTYQFAIYYKEWLSKGTAAPAIPYILTPKDSDRGASPGSSQGFSTELGLDPYDGIESPSQKPVVDVVKDGEGKENSSSFVESSAGAAEEEKGTYSPKVGACIEQHKQQESQNNIGDLSFQMNVFSPDHNLQDGVLLASENSQGSQYDDVRNVNKIKVKSSCKCCCLNFSGTATHLLSYTKANELALKELARTAFSLQDTEDFLDSMPTTNCNLVPEPTSYTNEIKISFCTDYELQKTTNAELPVTSLNAELCGNHKCCEGYSFPSIPKDLFCPITGRLFDDPVTLETGHTYERLAIKEWLDQGNRTCPATGQTLGSGVVPATNLVLKWVIDEWKSKHCRNLLCFAAQLGDDSTNHKCKSKDMATILILEQLLTGLDTKENTENAKRLISLGGLQFLVQRLELGDLKEKALTATLLSCCIKADGNCRIFLARNIGPSSLIQLLHNKQVASRTSALWLLTELICLNRRRAIILLLRVLEKEGEMNTMHVLLSYLQGSPAEQRPLIAVLLLHLVVLMELHGECIYGEEAVHALIAALECSLTNAKVREQSCRALSILGGQFSRLGEATIQTWLINQAGFYDGFDANSQDKFPHMDGIISLEEEEKEREEWLKIITGVLLGYGKNSFLETISKCLHSKIPDLFQVCLTTVAWISRVLAALPDEQLQPSVYASLIPQLKECLKNARIELRVLASMALLNFSQISECQVLVRTFAEEILAPLNSLSEVTWTAKHLHSIISMDTL